LTGAELEIEGFVELPRADTPFGVLCLLWKGEVVYVGKSKSVYDRLALITVRQKDTRVLPTYVGSSRATMAPPIRYDQAFVRFCAVEDLVRLEVKYQEKYRPRLNAAIPAAPKISMADLAQRAKVVL
jgi:hypothetical protein